MNKKKIAIISLSTVSVIAVIVVVLLLFFKPCEHQWKDATCEKAVTCEICGEVAGSLDHSQ